MSESGSRRIELGAHAATPGPAVHRLTASCRRSGKPDHLTLVYHLNGELAQLRLGMGRRGASEAGAAAQAGVVARARTDGLWRHTCMEAFVTGAAGEAYYEYHFAPSGAWAAYRFRGYRAGMEPLAEAQDPHIQAVPFEDSDLVLAAHITIPADLCGDGGGDGGGGVLRIGLAAVIEDRDGRLSYWALHHAADRPDFHHPASFVLESR